MDSFSIDNIDPIKDTAEVTFTIDGVDYPRTVAVPKDSSLTDMLDAMLSDMKATVQKPQ